MDFSTGAKQVLGDYDYTTENFFFTQERTFERQSARKPVQRK